MKETERTGRFQPFARPPETDHKRSLIEDSRSPFYVQVAGMLERPEVPEVSGSEGLTTIPLIEASLEFTGSYKRPPNSQMTQDLIALGFTKVRTKQARFWAVPKGYKAGETLDI